MPSTNRPLAPTKPDVPRPSARAVWAGGIVLAMSLACPGEAIPRATRERTAAADAAQQRAVRGDYERAERFSARALGERVFKTSVEPHWIENGPRFWYRNDVRGARQFVLVDPEKASRAPAFDHAKLAAALSKAAGKTYSPKRLPFVAIEFLGGGKSIAFRVRGVRWRCDLASYACTRRKHPATRSAPPKPRRASPKPRRPSARPRRPASHPRVGG